MGRIELEAVRGCLTGQMHGGINSNGLVAKLPFMDQIGTKMIKLWFLASEIWTFDNFNFNYNWNFIIRQRKIIQIGEQNKENVETWQTTMEKKMCGIVLWYNNHCRRGNNNNDDKILKILMAFILARDNRKNEIQMSRRGSKNPKHWSNIA